MRVLYDRRQRKTHFVLDVVALECFLNRPNNFELLGGDFRAGVGGLIGSASSLSDPGVDTMSRIFKPKSLGIVRGDRRAENDSDRSW